VTAPGVIAGARSAAWRKRSSPLRARSLVFRGRIVGTPPAMSVITRRNAVIGWIVTRIARKRVVRRLNAAAGNRRGRRWLALGTALVAGVAVSVGALVARRAAGTTAQAG
jgi:hypothetical protein